MSTKRRDEIAWLMQRACARKDPTQKPSTLVSHLAKTADLPADEKMQQFASALLAGANRHTAADAAFAWEVTSKQCYNHYYTLDSVAHPPNMPGTADEYARVLNISLDEMQQFFRLLLIEFVAELFNT